jgi:acetaldehyde dehydrogenase
VSAQQDWPVAIIGTGNIGTDLMLKIQRGRGPLRITAMAGIDPESAGLEWARRLGVPTTVDGVDGLLAMEHFKDIQLVFDASSAESHRANWNKLKPSGVRVLDLTPAAVGPPCVPVVNLDQHLGAPNLNMVTCGGQATVPIVAAIAQNGTVSYAEVVSAISARSAGPGTRASIDEFAETTSAALQSIGGSRRGKAIMILNPGDPPILMRNTVFCLVDGDADHIAIERSIVEMVCRVREYVPGYRLKQEIQFEDFTVNSPLYVPETGKFVGTRVTVMLEISGAADYLPAYAGNLDIMTSAAKTAAERIAANAFQSEGTQR